MGFTLYKLIYKRGLASPRLRRASHNLKPPLSKPKITELRFLHSFSVVCRHEFLGLPLSLVPCEFHCRAALQGSLSSVWNVCPVQPNFRFLISRLMFTWPVISRNFSLDITMGHQIFKIFCKHLFTKDWSFLWISYVTSQVWHPCSSTTDFISCYC
jgi:hypothetical protein